MATFSWKAAVVATLLLQVALLPAHAAPQGGGGISVYSLTDSNGQQHQGVATLSPQQTQVLVQQNAQQANALFNNSLGGLGAIGNIFSALLGGAGASTTAAAAPAKSVVVAPAPVRPVPVAPAPVVPAPVKPLKGEKRRGCASCSVDTDSSGHTHENVQHLNAQQAHQLFLENQQKLQSLFAANPFAGFFNPWLLPPLPTLTFNPFAPFPVPFLPAFAYLPAAFAANANSIVATANQAAVNNAARSKEAVDNVVGKIASASSAISSAVAAPLKAKE